MGPVGGRGFGGSVKFADGKTSSANVPHLNVWGFDISAAERWRTTFFRNYGMVDHEGKWLSWTIYNKVYNYGHCMYNSHESIVVHGLR